MEPVELNTGELVLRAWRAEDADAVHRACQDPLIRRWTTVPSPYELAHAANFVGEFAPAAWAANVGAPLGVFDAGTGQLLGSCGLVDLDLRGGDGEIGTWVAPWARGRGVAERAGRAVAHWGFEVLGLRRLTWRAEAGNHASKLVAERIGFTFDGVARSLLKARGGGFVDGWRGVLLPGEVRDTVPARMGRGGPAARRAGAFGAPPQRLPAGTVTLRRPAERDLDDMLATCRDPDAGRWTTVPVPYQRAHAESFVHKRAPAGWLHGTAATFTIADDGDRFCGTIELRIRPDDPDTAEIGYLVAPWARGKGYATESTRALCAYGFDRLALDRIIWRAHVGNDASRRVAAKVGFVEEGIQRRGCEQRGDRRDAWVATLLATDQR